MLSEEHESLKNSNIQRLNQLRANGVMLQGLGDAYVIRMLEALLGDDLPQVAWDHEVFTAEQITTAEEQLRRNTLLKGIGGIPR